ncbi:hypothetical protein PHYPSEUDO_007014 [Phytophthora pseudosyringae]|uniref:NADH:flavin oxidoreductase/NADH oxidase N-terminal domain-containing protein n=1 Tax=Phytophthora pseudosyringae TaxID=221518 RepID=A0A8T1VKB3_9STRA|nr:hypothetical protein PHYPSEUDO_007014 [Phytophthora pseudosyringae]
MAPKTDSYTLFTPLHVGKGLEIKNRIVHGPVTRARSDIRTHAPLERNAVYYEQRANAGLIITEACAISEEGFGWYGSPALYTDEQVQGWKEVVDRVHKKGGKIFVQLWHMGRQSHPSFHANNEVVSSSATLYATGRTRDADGEHVGYERARALALDEIPEVVKQWHTCAERAKEAGFDGIEVHAAGGYLIDQFLQSCTNQRTDSYGGSFENRYRFLNDVIEAVKTVYPADRIGVRTAPNSPYGGMGSVDNVEMFTYVYERLSKHGLAYLAILDGWEGVGADAHYHGKCRPLSTFDAKKAFKGTVIANKGYSRDTAEGVLRSGSADLVGFARMFMSNPDLVARFKNDQPLTPLMGYEFFWDPAKEYFASAEAGDEDLSTWNEADKEENTVVEVRAPRNFAGNGRATKVAVAQEEAGPEQLNEEEDDDDDPPYERKMSPRERLALEEEERWQRTLEEIERREREEASQDPDHGGDTPQEDVEASEMEQTDYSGGDKQEVNENDVPQDEDDAYDSYIEMQRRLEEQGSQSADGDEEEEALPVIPGLTDVELVAFNAEYANEEVLDKIIDWSYDQVADTSRYRDNYIHVEDLYQFLLKTLNPLDEEIDAEDERILTDAVTELRRQQGLVDEEQIVYRGFIARGMPLRFLQSLAHDMHKTVQTRRLQASRNEL